jgi:NAD(P)-dependent dehydrogenase (short-subunit alcohol dehydrogenase family)
LLCSIVPADVSTSDGIARLIANISEISGGQLDILVNNAGNLASGLVRVPTTRAVCVLSTACNNTLFFAVIWVGDMEGRVL